MFENLNKIRNKLLLVLLLVTLLPTVLIGGYALIFTTDTLHDSSLSIESAKVNLISEKIQNYLDQVNSDLFYLRDSNALNLYISALQSTSDHKKRLMLTNLRNSFKKFTTQKKNYQQVRFINREGLEVVRINYLDGRAKNISDTGLQNKQEMSYFKNAIALEKGDLFISSLELNRENNAVEKPIKPTIRYATPVYDQSNTLLGVIVLNVDMKKIMKVMTNEMQAGSQMQFVSPEGYYYFHPDASKTWGSKNDLNTKVNLLTETPQLSDAIKKLSTLGNISTDDNIVTYKSIKINDAKFNLGVILNIQPKELVFQSATQFFYIFIGIIILALILTFILAILLSNSISRPLILLTDDVDRLSKGDLETPISVKSHDEIGKLSTAIERLRKSMKILMRRAG
jgi:nitrogen fixation/metabolism regulation signal transduction histidine kinase